MLTINKALHKHTTAAAAHLLAAATLLATPTVSAQGANYHIPSNTPTTGTCNVIPFGNTLPLWKNIKYQCLATQPQLGNSTTLEICDLAFSPCGSGYTKFNSIEIVLAQTNAALSTTFSTNLVTNVKTVLSAKNYVWHHRANQFNKIGFDSSYSYSAGSHPNLVVQITVVGGLETKLSGAIGFHRDSTVPRIFTLGWTGTTPTTGIADTAALKFEVVSRTPDAHTFGLGCAGSKGVPTLGFSSAPKIGGTMNIHVGNCVANAPALHVFSLKRLEPGIDLRFLSAPGCTLYIGVDQIVPVAADATGSYVIKATLPNDKNLVCLRMYTQTFPADKTANAWQHTASNYGRILPGF